MRGYVQFNKYTHTLSLTSATTAQERDRGTAVGNFDLQQQVASPRPEACRNRGNGINGQDRWENGDGAARGVVRNNDRCNDSVEEGDGIKVGSRKRKRRDSVSPLLRLIRSCRRSSNH